MDSNTSGRLFLVENIVRDTSERGYVADIGNTTDNHMYERPDALLQLSLVAVVSVDSLSNDALAALIYIMLYSVHKCFSCPIPSHAANSLMLYRS